MLKHVTFVFVGIENDVTMIACHLVKLQIILKLNEGKTTRHNYLNKIMAIFSYLEELFSHLIWRLWDEKWNTSETAVESILYMLSLQTQRQVTRFRDPCFPYWVYQIIFSCFFLQRTWKSYMLKRLKTGTQMVVIVGKLTWAQVRLHINRSKRWPDGPKTTLTRPYLVVIVADSFYRMTAIRRR